VEDRPRRMILWYLLLSCAVIGFFLVLYYR